MCAIYWSWQATGVSVQPHQVFAVINNLWWRRRIAGRRVTATTSSRLCARWRAEGRPAETSVGAAIGWLSSPLRGPRDALESGRTRPLSVSVAGFPVVLPVELMLPRNSTGLTLPHLSFARSTRVAFWPSGPGSQVYVPIACGQCAGTILCTMFVSCPASAVFSCAAAAASSGFVGFQFLQATGRPARGEDQPASVWCRNSRAVPAAVVAGFEPRGGHGYRFPRWRRPLLLDG